MSSNERRALCLAALSLLLISVFSFAPLTGVHAQSPPPATPFYASYVGDTGATTFYADYGTEVCQYAGYTWWFYLNQTGTYPSVTYTMQYRVTVNGLGWSGPDTIANPSFASFKAVYQVDAVCDADAVRLGLQVTTTDSFQIMVLPGTMHANNQSVSWGGFMNDTAAWNVLLSGFQVTKPFSGASEIWIAGISSADHAVVNLWNGGAWFSDSVSSVPAKWLGFVNTYGSNAYNIIIGVWQANNYTTFGWSNYDGFDLFGHPAGPTLSAGTSSVLALMPADSSHCNALACAAYLFNSNGQIYNVSTHFNFDTQLNQSGTWAFPDEASPYVQWQSLAATSNASSVFLFAGVNGAGLNMTTYQASVSSWSSPTDWVNATFPNTPVQAAATPNIFTMPTFINQIPVFYQLSGLSGTAPTYYIGYTEQVLRFPLGVTELPSALLSASTLYFQGSETPIPARLYGLAVAESTNFTALNSWSSGVGNTTYLYTFGNFTVSFGNGTTLAFLGSPAPGGIATTFMLDFNQLTNVTLEYTATLNPPYGCQTCTVTETTTSVSTVTKQATTQDFTVIEIIVLVAFLTAILAAARSMWSHRQQENGSYG